ncbi:MAG: hypothetical protein ACREIU_05940 [Planctomycetota bacterium]
MRWVLLPLLLAAAGALAGVVDAVVAQTLLDRYWSDLYAACAWIGGGIALGIGISLALALRLWGLVLLAPFFGAAGYATAVVFAANLGGDHVPTLQEFLKDPFTTRLAAVAAPVLVAAHLSYARATWLRASLRRAIGFYAVLGALSGSVFWAGVPRFSWAAAFRTEFWVGLLCGAFYGLVQLGAVRLLERMASRGPRIENRP